MFEICGWCNGSGEGITPHSGCSKCGGSGEVWVEDSEPDEDFDDDDEAED